VLGKEPALRPVDDPIRIVSAEADQPVRRVQKPRKAIAPVAEPNGNGPGHNGKATHHPMPLPTVEPKEPDTQAVPVPVATSNGVLHDLIGQVGSLWRALGG